MVQVGRPRKHGSRNMAQEAQIRESGSGRAVQGVVQGIPERVIDELLKKQAR